MRPIGREGKGSMDGAGWCWESKYRRRGRKILGVLWLRERDSCSGKWQT